VVRDIVVSLLGILVLTIFLALFACAPPELDFTAPVVEEPKVKTNCKMTVVNRHTQDGALCTGNYLATGLVSISPTKIQCAQVDLDCQ
jgi:hypothetical protein